MRITGTNISASEGLDRILAHHEMDEKRQAQQNVISLFDFRKTTDAEN